MAGFRRRSLLMRIAARVISKAVNIPAVRNATRAGMRTLLVTVERKSKFRTNTVAVTPVPLARTAPTPALWVAIAAARRILRTGAAKTEEKPAFLAVAQTPQAMAGAGTKRAAEVVSGFIKIQRAIDLYQFLTANPWKVTAYLGRV